MLCECVRHSSWKEIGMPDLPPNRSTASTASVAKWSFSCCNLGEAAGPMQRTEKYAGSLKKSLDDYDIFFKLFNTLWWLCNTLWIFLWVHKAKKICVAIRMTRMTHERAFHKQQAVQSHMAIQDRSLTFMCSTSFNADSPWSTQQLSFWQLRAQGGPCDTQQILESWKPSSGKLVKQCDISQQHLWLYLEANSHPHPHTLHGQDPATTWDRWTPIKNRMLIFSISTGINCYHTRLASTVLDIRKFPFLSISSPNTTSVFVLPKLHRIFPIVHGQSL